MLFADVTTLNSNRFQIWRLAMFVATLLAITLTSGCHYLSDEFGQEKMIPNPLPDRFPYQLKGTAYKIWIGNEFQLKSGLHTSYVLMQGVNNPDTGDELEHMAVAHLKKLTADHELRIHVRARDELEKVIGHVYVGQRNINLEMIQSGWARFDGSEFSESKEFADAQTDARLNKRGMWAHLDGD